MSGPPQASEYERLGGRRPSGMHLKDLAVNLELARLEPLRVEDPKGGLMAGRVPEWRDAICAA